MKKLAACFAAVLCVLCLAAAPASADLDFYIFDTTGQDPETRYEYNDIVDVQYSAGVLTLPNLGPFRVIRVQTTRTKEEALSYLAPKMTGNNRVRRRQWYLDTSLMSSADLTFWNANRAIETTEATALSWLSQKP